MNKHLVDFINNKIEAASRFITNYMPADIDTDAAYEAMLACNTTHAYTSEVITAFQAVAKYLPEASQHKRFTLTLNDRPTTVVVRLNPTERWPMFLFPDGELVVTPESKLAELMAIPVRVATEWESLRWVWSEFVKDEVELNPYTLAYLMPWIREVLADFDTTRLPVDTSIQKDVKQAERKAIDKEIATIMRDWNVAFFPRMSKSLSAIARSGQTLFAQYRLLEASYSKLSDPVITVLPTPSLVPAWAREHMDETLQEWENDKRERLHRELYAAAAKAANKVQPT